MKELFKKIVNFASSATTITTFFALLAGYFTAYFGVLTERISIPVWLLIIAVFIPFAVWAFIRHRLQMKKRKYKTGDLVGILGDKRPFVVYEYYIWQPLYIKLKERDGNYAICAHQTFIVDYEEKSKSELSLSKTLDAITQRGQPKYTATIVKL